MFRSEISPMLHNYKTLQNENELKYLNAQLIEAVSDKNLPLVKKLLGKIGDRHKQNQTLLNIAINGDDAKTAEVLFEHDPKLISLPNNKGLSPLLAAIGKGKKNIVDLLLKYNVDVDKEFDGISPISLAVSKGFTGIVDALIKYKKALPALKVTMEQKTASFYHDEYGRTLLTIASERNDIKTAKCIIEHYPELVSELNADGSSALFVAASKGNGEIVDLLISKRANVNQTINDATPIYMAAAKGYHIIVKLLLDHKADANQFYQNIQSTLSAAISSGNIETVAVLLEANANINTVDRDGMTPLHTAVHYQNYAMVELILKYNPKDDLSKKDFLHMATANVSLTRCLLEAKVDENTIANESIKNQFYDVIEGYTPLTAAIVKNHDFLVHLEFTKSLQSIRLFQPPSLESKGSYGKVIAALLEKKPQLDKPDSKGYLPLHYAAKFGDTELAKKLVESNADINMSTSKCYAPLIIAIHYNKRDVLNYLLDKKADIRCTDKNNYDLLMIAVYGGSYDVVSPLSKYFDVNTIDSNEMTPLMAAIYQYSESSERILKIQYLSTMVELLKNKASFMKKGPRSDCSAISFVIQKNLNNLLPALLEHRTGDNLNTYSNKTFCPLHEAVISNNEEACKILLAQTSVNVNQSDGNGLPPLYYAIIKKQKNMAELLLRNSANTTSKCINNKSTLDDLLQLDKHKEMRQFIQSIKVERPALKR